MTGRTGQRNGPRVTIVGDLRELQESLRRTAEVSSKALVIIRPAFVENLAESAESLRKLGRDFSQTAFGRDGGQAA